MKRTFFIIIGLSLFFVLSAQKQVFIEPAILEVHYYKTMQQDTIRKNKIETDSMILRIGKHSSQFFSYYVFMEDSLWNDPKGRGIVENLKIKTFETNDFTNFIGTHTTDEFLYKNFPKDSLTVTTRRLVAGFKYAEEYKPQSWVLIDSAKQILNHPCKLARCAFRGREWYAWYAEDIPISDGPWKLTGLPGLILHAYDKNKNYEYIAKVINDRHVTPVTFYDFYENGFIFTQRTTFLKAKYDFISGKSSDEIDLIKNVYWGGKKINYLTSSRKRLHYDFKEIDYK